MYAKDRLDDYGYKMLVHKFFIFLIEFLKFETRRVTLTKLIFPPTKKKFCFSLNLINEVTAMLKINNLLYNVTAALKTNKYMLILSDKENWWSYFTAYY